MTEKKDTGTKLIATNPTARQSYHLNEIVEAGIALQGTEVKSLRNQAPNLRDAYVEVISVKSSHEAYLVNAHIGPYTHGNIWNHDPLRKRKLLLHTHQLKRLFGAVTQDGMTIIPTQMYFKSGKVKIEIAIAQGKKHHDRREDSKKKSAEREMEQALKASRNKK